jgi:hypothetical protein
MDKMWREIKQIRLKSIPDHEDIEKLIGYIIALKNTNDKVGQELGNALESLDTLHDRLKFYRQVTISDVSDDGAAKRNELY